MEKLISNVRLLCICIFVLMTSFPVPVTSQAGSCILKGRISTSLEWYGYLLQKTFQRNISRIQYTISYPITECCANLLIYYDDQMRFLNKDMTCREREAILPPSNNQLIPLVVENGTVGCEVWDGTAEGKESMYVCKGERTFRSSAPRRWYIAISRCNATTPLTMNYMFNISGYYGNCEEDPLVNTFVPELQVEKDDSSYKVAVAMGVIAGIATLVAVVFITLFVLNRRQMNQKPKSGSVTSSQATMTQDIFYVNPSLSDREHSDSQYSRSSSENYYEVIPDRRSYESINTQLALHGHPGRTLNLAGLSREHRARIPSYIFEDIPPPPYQPPNLQGQALAHQHAHAHQHQHQGSNSGHPLSQANGHSPYGTGLHQLSMAGRLIPLSGAQQGTLTNRLPVHSSAVAHAAAMTSGNSLTLASHTTIGNHPSSTTAASTASAAATGTSGTSLQNQNGGITTSAGGLNSQNTNTLPRSLNSEHPIPLQNGGPVQNGVLSHGTVGRYPLHNSNHAKLLNHAYRIQQFETTA